MCQRQQKKVSSRLHTFCLDVGTDSFSADLHRTDHHDSRNSGLMGLQRGHCRCSIAAVGLGNAIANCLTHLRQNVHLHSSKHSIKDCQIACANMHEQFS